MRVLWRRWLTNPRTRVLTREEGRTHVKIDGLVCDRVCAARSRRALEALPGVRRVTVDLDSGIAVVDGPPYDDATYEQAVRRAVKMKPLRAALESIGRRFGYRERIPA